MLRNLSIIVCMAVCIAVLAYEMTYTIPTAMQAKICNEFVQKNPQWAQIWYDSIVRSDVLLLNGTGELNMTMPREWGIKGP